MTKEQDGIAFEAAKRFAAQHETKIEIIYAIEIKSWKVKFYVPGKAGFNWGESFTEAVKLAMQDWLEHYVVESKISAWAIVDQIFNSLREES